MSQFRIIDYNYIFDSTVRIRNAFPTDQNATFPIDNLRKFSLSKVFRTEGESASVRLVFDLLTPSTIDTLAVLFDKQSDISISPGATIALQAHHVDQWSSPEQSFLLSVDDVHHCITKFLTPNTYEYRFWSLFIYDTVQPFGYIEIPKIILGNSTRLGQMPSLGFDVSIMDQSKIQSNVYGNEFADTYPERRYANFQHKLLTEADKQTLREIYYRVGKVKPILLSLDPDEDFFSDNNEHLFYGFLDNDFKAVNPVSSYFDVDMAMREIV